MSFNEYTERIRGLEGNGFPTLDDKELRERCMKIIRDGNPMERGNSKGVCYIVISWTMDVAVPDRCARPESGAFHLAQDIPRGDFNLVLGTLVFKCSKVTCEEKSAYRCN